MNLKKEAKKIYEQIKTLYQLIALKSIIVEDESKEIIETIEDLEKNILIHSQKFSIKDNIKEKSYYGSNNERIFFQNENIKKSTDIINNILQNKALYYFSKQDIIRPIVDTIIDMKDNKNEEQLIDKWYEFLSQPTNTYTIMHPIFNINFDNIVAIGPFKLQQKENLSIKDISYNHKEALFLDKNYISIKIQAKSANRAKDLSTEYFLLFEDVSRYLLSDYNCYDVYIFSEKTLSFSDYKILSDNNTLLQMEFSVGNSIKPLKITQLSDYDKKVWSLVTKYYRNKTYNETISPIEQRLLRAIQFIGKANNTHFNANKYILYVFAIECLLSQQSSGFITPSISYQIAESCSFIIGENFEKYLKTPSALPPNIETKKDYRSFLFKKAKKIYSNRSKYVHGNIDGVKSEDLTSVIDLTNRLIYSFFTNEELLKLDNMEQLQEWIQDKRFS